jgi:hypothetical protein
MSRQLAKVGCFPHHIIGKLPVFVARGKRVTAVEEVRNTSVTMPAVYVKGV